MKTTKITISPEVREFNEAVEHTDFLLDYQFDTEPALALLDHLEYRECYPHSAQALREAIVNLEIKR